MRTLQESFVKGIEAAAAKSALAVLWLRSPLYSFGESYPGKSSQKGGSASPLHRGSLQTHSSDCKCHLVIRGGCLSERADSLLCIDLAWWQLLCSELGAAGTQRDAEVGLAAGLGSRASRNFLDLP